MSGVVSGTLTPLGFLSATLASTPSKSALVVALLSAGVSDGLSDVAAGAQANQSESRVSPLSQTSIFMKTLAAKCLIPCSFIPVVLALESNVAIAAVTAGIAAVLLASTATVQALARERPVLPAVAKLLGWGAAVSLVGTGIGAAVPEVFRAATRG
jgi:hypothetical protein